MFDRKLALGIMVCQPQCLEVWAPPGDLLGRIRETFSCFNTEYVVENANRDIIYQIEGPPRLVCICRRKEMHLKVLSNDQKIQHGMITRIWNTDICTYTQNVYFMDPNLDVNHKALMIGAAFLMVTHYIL